MTSPAAETRCVACHATFRFDADFYRLKRLAPPKACRPCREERASRVVTMLATVQRVAPSYIFAKAPTGAVYFVAPACVAADVGELHVGDHVALDVDPDAPVAPGRKPRALRVRRP